MCGVYGGVFRDEGPATRRFMSRCREALAMRGPDAEASVRVAVGEWTVGMGHRRLSVIDLSADGSQPMWLQQRLLLNYNGEVYNYVELRETLARNGFHCRTESDTEVLIQAFACWGEEALSRIRGMFAFALLDLAKPTLYLVRDRFGVKPLYWALGDNELYFASLARPIAERTSSRPNPAFVAKGLRSLTFDDDSESTQYEGVAAVRPGHVYRFALGAGRLSVSRRRYYDLRERVLSAPEQPVSEAAVVEECHARLRDAVRIRLRADVPVAVSLSGGLDSASIAAIARQEGSSLVGYCYGRPEVRATEAAVAARLGRFAKIDLRWVYPSDEETERTFWLALEAQDAPFSTMSIPAQFAVYRAARVDGFKVVLGGQGGDEVFLGYRKALLWALSDGVQNGTPTRVMSTTVGVVLAALAEAPRAGLYLGRLGRRWRGRPTAVRGWPPDLAATRPAGFRDRQIHDLVEGGLPTLLRYEDRNSMANSIESRLPFMDHELVEWAVRLPAALKVRNGFGKWVLRKAMEGSVPEEIVWTRAKRGFDVPGPSSSLCRSIRAELQRLKPRLRSAGVELGEIDRDFADGALRRSGGTFADAVATIWFGRAAA